MKKKFTGRLTALTAAAAMLAGAAVSCSKGNGGSSKNEGGDSKDPQTLMAGSYHAVEFTAEVKFNNVSGFSLIGDDKVFICDENYETGIPDLYIADKDFTNIEKINMDLSIPENGNNYANAYASPDGNIMVMVTFNDYGDFELPDYDDPDFDYENFDYEAMEEARTTTYKIYTVDLDGTVISENELSNVEEYAEEDVYMGNFTPCSGGRALIRTYGDNEGLLLVDSDGKITDNLTVEGINWFDTMAYIGNNKLAITGYGDKGQQLLFLDMETMKTEEGNIDLEKENFNNISSVFPGSGDYSFYINTSSDLYGINEDGSSVKILNWLDADLGNGNLTALLPVGEEFIVSYYDYNGGNGLYKLTQRDPSELENVKIITVGTLYDDYNVKNKISEFNKSHENIRLKMVSYQEYDVYDEASEKMTSTAQDQLKLDVISGKAPDIIVSYSRNIISTLANKGLYLDLYELIDSDPELSRDDFVENVIKCYETDGKLYSLSPTFSIQTYAVKKKFIDKAPWTVDDMIELYDSLPENTNFTEFDSKDMIMSMIINMVSGEMDYKNGTCNFDTPEIRKLMEFSDNFISFEEMIDWDDQEAVDDFYNDREGMYLDDRAVLKNLYLHDFRSYAQELKGYFGEDITLVGYPSSKGNGAKINSNNNIAILSNCSDKEAAWEFVKTFLDDKSGYGGGFSILKENFDELAEDSMNKPYYLDENGKKVEYDDTVWLGGDSRRTIDPLTKEEKDFIYNYITSTTTLNDDYNYSDEIYSIIWEEFQAYFNGEKSADETLSLLQNRISILLSEQS